jgi:signal transduction histidine kinase
MEAAPTAPRVERALGSALGNGAPSRARGASRMGDGARRRMTRGARGDLAGAPEKDEPPSRSAHLSPAVGWLVSGLGPLAAVAALEPLALATPHPADVVEAYGLIVLALAAIVATIWGAGPAIVALGECPMGLIALLLPRGRAGAGGRDGGLALDIGLLMVMVAAVAAVGAIAIRLERARRDVARLKLTEARERARADAALDAAQEALVFLDQAGRVTRLNQQARHLFATLGVDAAAGPRAAALAWLRGDQPLSEGDSPAGRALRGELVREEVAVVAPHAADDDLTRRLTLVISAAPILGPDGVIAGAVISAREVGGAAESPPREWPLVWTERMDAFIGMASHELRTPLTTIKASVQLGLRKLSRTNQQALIASDLQQLLMRAEEQVGRMTRLIEDLLDTARIASGSMTLRFERCDLLALTREAIHDAQLRAPARAIWLRTDGEPALIWGDPGRLSQVIGEYISNALKFSDASQPVEAHISGRWRAHGKDELGARDDNLDGVERWQARVTVRDHGPGVKSEALERVWDRFYQDPELAARVGSEVGLGLGLALCRSIVEAHHGAVGVESASGGGALFWLALPRLAE